MTLACLLGAVLLTDVDNGGQIHINISKEALGWGGRLKISHFVFCQIL